MTILLLGGTAEARELSGAIPGLGLSLITSLAGATKRPAPQGGALRLGGFGGVAGLTDFLKSSGVTAVIDATHPFALGMSANAVKAARATATPLLQLLRPPWPSEPGWHMVPDLAAAAAALPVGAHAFLATGRAL